MGISWGAIALALIATIPAWLALRSAKATARLAAASNQETAKIAAETESYERARKMDIQTIERQNLELAEYEKERLEIDKRLRTLETDNRKLRQKCHEQQNEIDDLNRKVYELEKGT